MREIGFQYREALGMTLSEMNSWLDILNDHNRRANKVVENARGN